MLLLSWSYAGADAGSASADDGRQHAHSGDRGYDDELGVTLIDKLDGEYVFSWSSASAASANRSRDERQSTL